MPRDPISHVRNFQVQATMGRLVAVVILTFSSLRATSAWNWRREASSSTVVASRFFICSISCTPPSGTQIAAASKGQWEVQAPALVIATQGKICLQARQVYRWTNQPCIAIYWGCGRHTVCGGSPV